MRGRRKTVIHIEQPDSAAIEEAIFILRDGVQPPPSDLAAEMARMLDERFSLPPAVGRPGRARLILCLFGAAGLALLAAATLLILRIAL